MARALTRSRAPERQGKRMDEKEKTSPEVAKARYEKVGPSGALWRDHNLHYLFKNFGHGDISSDCEIEVDIRTKLQPEELTEVFMNMSRAIVGDIGKR